jgi:hypothetical protein
MKTVVSHKVNINLRNLYAVMTSDCAPWSYMESRSSHFMEPYGLLHCSQHANTRSSSGNIISNFRKANFAVMNVNVNAVILDKRLLK